MTDEYLLPNASFNRLLSEYRTYGSLVVAYDFSLTFTDRSKIYVDYIFYRKKDAKKYLDIVSYKKYFEVTGVTIDKSLKDNRRSKK